MVVGVGMIFEAIIQSNMEEDVSHHNKEHISETWAGIISGFSAILYVSFIYDKLCCTEKMEKWLKKDSAALNNRQNGGDNHGSIHNNTQYFLLKESSVNKKISILGQKEENIAVNVKNHSSVNTHKKIQITLLKQQDLSDNNGKANPIKKSLISNALNYIRNLSFFNNNVVPSNTHQPTNSPTQVDIKYVPLG